MKYEQIDKDTFLIKEMCFCYLLRGSEKCLLIDTGIGLQSLKKTVLKLAEGKPIIVVNTHGHIDHFGNDDEFGGAFVPTQDQGVVALQNTVAFRQAFLSRGNWLQRTFLKKVLIPKKLNLTWFSPDQVFELGNRLITCIATPGHTPGSICLLDASHRLLFGGDTVVPHLVLLDLDYSLDAKTFYESMLKIKNLSEQFDVILPGHHHVTRDKSLIDDYLACALKAQETPGTICHNGLGMARVTNYGNVKIFTKVVE
jgi:glyoxylase-like metal-dependent hydrolase (beta-lactamase superfamily II)